MTSTAILAHYCRPLVPPHSRVRPFVERECASLMATPCQFKKPASNVWATSTFHINSSFPLVFRVSQNYSPKPKRLCSSRPHGYCIELRFHFGGNASTPLT